ncbi:hypothetical protein BIW11_03034 [Tropilaelaps mercedesae]|uniref:Uncharacterized protein n=1 Tax=Tropilaelaps mercedesae TaxID=418985 RepID=A0A1V9XT28_9ACAR|nr:hypothetical protein BIW11_03034 [Tropilaelaps mercedesae]
MGLSLAISMRSLQRKKVSISKQKEMLEVKS